MGRGGWVWWNGSLAHFPFIASSKTRSHSLPQTPSPHLSSSPNIRLGDEIRHKKEVKGFHLYLFSSLNPLSSPFPVPSYIREEWTGREDTREEAGRWLSHQAFPSTASTRFFRSPLLSFLSLIGSDLVWWKEWMNGKGNWVSFICPSPFIPVPLVSSFLRHPSTSVISLVNEKEIDDREKEESGGNWRKEKDPHFLRRYPSICIFSFTS